MGNAASTSAPLAGSGAQPPASTSHSQRSRPSILRRVREPSSDSQQSAPPARSTRPRPASIARLSQLLRSHDAAPESELTTTTTTTTRTTTTTTQRPSFAARLQRHSLFLGAPSGLFARRPSSRQNEQDTLTTSQAQSLWPSERDDATANANAASIAPSNPNTTDLTLPDVETPELDIDFTLSSSASASGPATGSRSPSRRSSTRLANTLSDRLAAIRPNRHQATGGAVLRRRRPAQSAAGEENTVLLSRLLSVAAATTAETLLEGSGETMENARGHASDGDDGSFSSFLRSLESGRLAAALRQPLQPPAGSPNAAPAPLNFFRVFRFGAQPANRNNPRAPTGDHRMVPIIIVGIRAVPAGSANTADDTTNAPFLDALSNLPTTPLNASTFGQDLTDSLRGSSNSSRFSARRRSMGGLSRFPLGYDNQRHHRSPERQRSASVASELNSSWPRPPPTSTPTPAASNVASPDNTPAATAPTSRRSSYSSTPRRENIIRTTTTTTLETTAEDAPVRTRPARQRRLSESDNRNSFPGTRRNGIVEPDNGSGSALPENTRSWIIYVLGGSYPENHPILTTPSLFTDSPTYEDMMLLSSLLGPVKPPVATDTDIKSAGGLFTIQCKTNTSGARGLVAVAVEGQDCVELAVEQRCLVCLCDMEEGEEARRLNDCGHLYHRECIDEWLTKGRNSCPLCRGKGVQEKKAGEGDKATANPPAVDSAVASPVIPSEPGRAVAA